MTFFITIIIKGLRRIFLRPSASIFNFTKVASQDVCCINPDSRVGMLKPSFLVPSLPFLLLLPLFPSLLRVFSAIGGLRSWGLLLLGFELRFFNLYVLHWLALSTGFGCWRPTIPEAVLISIASIRARPKGGFGFGVNSFFDYFFKVIELLVALLYFNLDWKPEALPKVLNYCIFF